MNRILIIESEEKTVELMKNYLELSNFDVIIEPDGEKGARLAIKEEYELLLLSLEIPSVDAFSLCDKVRKTRDIPIVIISIKNDDGSKIRALGQGADDYIIKPFSPSELVARVKAHLAFYNRLVSNNFVENEYIEIGDISIDKKARRVFVKGKEKNLTLKEFELLSFLAENPNRVFSKEKLFQQIWGVESYGDIATVTVHIKKIREKIEENSSKPKYIETIWGVGYRFE